ncbi:MAG: 6-phosphogluconolactonase [Chloroflexota bacterium]
MHNIDIYDDKPALIEAAAKLFVEQAAATQDKFTVALAGGSTPLPVYELLATDTYASQVDWNKVHIFFGDERAVPKTHQDSNYGAAQTAFLSHIPIRLENVHRMKGELPVEEAAKDYGLMLKDFFDGGPPAFDLHYLGMGGDGHTLSLFPGVMDALNETEHRVVATGDDKHPHERITLTAWAANASKVVAVLVSGEGKADKLREVLEGEYTPERNPIQLIKPSPGQLLWMVDQAAASKLTDDE